MKPLKPGQLAIINNNLFRAKRRNGGCEGCFFEHSFFTCPGIVDFKTGKRKLDCDENLVILVKVLGINPTLSHLHRNQLKRKPQARKSNR